MSIRKISLALWDGVTSLKLTITCLVMLMVLVVACTLAQVSLGMHAAVNEYIRAFAVLWDVPGTNFAIPVFPGGGLVGLVLLLNLVAAQARRLEFSLRKAGLWVIHAGLILLFAGEFVTGMFQVEMQLAIEQGQTLDFVESPREMELALTDTASPQHDEVYGIPEGLLARGGTIAVPGTPLTVQVKSFFQNADLTDGPGVATAGVGTGVAVRELSPVSGDDEQDRRAAVVEIFSGAESHGTWLLSNALGAPQSFTQDGHTWFLSLRPRRQYLPYKLTLKKFSHDVYAGTDIPKNFSSLVRLEGAGQSRDVLIYMNQPLRFDGKAFYQASFGKNDTLSILQVVENPGWLLPYLSCVLVALGLVIHFFLSLSRSMRKQQRLHAPVGA